MYNYPKSRVDILVNIFGKLSDEEALEFFNRTELITVEQRDAESNQNSKQAEAINQAC